MIEKKFVGHPALTTYLCHTYLITTFEISYTEYRQIYPDIRIFLLPDIAIGIGPKNPTLAGPYSSLLSM